MSLGLVLFSTLLEPADDARWCWAVGLVTDGAYCRPTSQDLAGPGPATFLVLWVLLPSVLGICRPPACSAGTAWSGSATALGSATSPACFTLCYANAATCLPGIVRKPDWDLLGLSLAMVAGLCMIAFASGGILGRAVDAGGPQRVALMFGLGMNNNGTGLVLASMALGSDPIVMLPIILYNLVQHVAAGCVSRLITEQSSMPHRQRGRRAVHSLEMCPMRSGTCRSGPQESDPPGRSMSTVDLVACTIEAISPGRVPHTRGIAGNSATSWPGRLRARTRRSPTTRGCSGPSAGRRRRGPRRRGW